MEKSKLCWRLNFKTSHSNVQYLKTRLVKTKERTTYKLTPDLWLHPLTILPPCPSSSAAQRLMTLDRVQGIVVKSKQRGTYMQKFKISFFTNVYANLVSWHLCTWVHFLARHEIRTNNYILLQFQFPKETNTRGSKAPTPFTPFHTNLQSFD